MKKVVLILMLTLISTVIFAQPVDLFISEYIEGSSYNQAIEIFNGTGSSVNLDEFSVKRANNGDVRSYTETLSGTLENNDVFVLANLQACQSDRYIR